MLFVGKAFPRYCVEQWPSAKLRLTYSILVVIGQFVTPLTVTLVLYARIGWWLSRRRAIINRAASCLQNRESQAVSTSCLSAPLSLSEQPRSPRKKNKKGSTESNGVSSSPLAARLERRTKRTHRILVGIVACFAGCWTPWTLYSLYLECLAYWFIGEGHPPPMPPLLPPPVSTLYGDGAWTHGNTNISSTPFAATALGSDNHNSSSGSVVVNASIKTTDLILKVGFITKF